MNYEMQIRWLHFGRDIIRLSLAAMALSVLFVARSVTAQGLQTPVPSQLTGVEDWPNVQAQILLDLADEALIQWPPALPEPMERRMALLMIDGVVHAEDAPNYPAVQAFLRSRVNVAMQEIEDVKIEKGAMIWKIYNHGFIVRTATVTIGFDLTRARLRDVADFGLTDNVLARIIRQCDALFISHQHSDHADEWVAQAFIDQGKPVVAPSQVWSDQPIHQQITHLKREAHILQSLPIQNGKRALKVVVYPGHQGSNILCNNSLVFTPEGMSFVHTGDQSNSDDFAWVDQVSQYHRVDVLMPNCWTPDIDRMARGFNPALIITGHENEMGHTPNHREPFWLTYAKLEQVPYPLVLMAWGESFHYQPSTR